MKIIEKIILMMIVIYQKSLSRLLGKHCRFYPTCSQYCADSIKHYGIIKGLLKGILRILRCNPFFPGGYDPAVKEN